MYCPKCGAELRDGAAFCPACGERVGQAAGEPKPTMAQEAPAPQGPGRRSVSRRAVLAGLGAVAAVGAVVLASGLLGHQDPAEDADAGGEDDGVARAAYGSRAATLVSRVTRVVPTDSSGKPVARYTVRVRSATDANGVDVDVSAIAPLEVEDTDGFTLGEVAGLEEGMVVEATVTVEDGTPQWLPPLWFLGDDVSDAGPMAAAGSAGSEDTRTEPPETLLVLPAELLEDEGTDADASPHLGKWAALLSTARTAQEAHGEAEVRSSSGEYSSFVWLDGLCIARLLDFGDGDRRLLLAYPAQDVSSFPTGGADTYTVEIWRYDAETDAPTLELSLGSGFTNGGQKTLYFSEAERDGITYWYVTQLFDGDSGERVYGLSDDGSVGQVCKLGYDFASSSYLVNDAVVDQATYEATVAQYGLDFTSGNGTTTTYVFASPLPWAEENEVWPEDIVQETQDTLAQLEDIAGDVLDAWLAQTDGEGEEDSDAAAETPAWSAAFEQFVLGGDFLQSGQDYADEAGRSDNGAFLFALHDADGDGAPELVTFNGYEAEGSSAWYLYGCVNGSVSYLGSLGGRHDETPRRVEGGGSYPGIFRGFGNRGIWDTYYYEPVDGSLETTQVEETQEGTQTYVTDDSALLAANEAATAFTMVTLADIESMGWEAFAAAQGYAASTASGT